MKNLLIKAPLFLITYLSLGIIFIYTQFSNRLQIYFPLFAVEGETFTEGAIELANTIEQTFIEPRRDNNTVIMASAGIDAIEVPLPSELEPEDSVFAVMDEPEPEPEYGPPVEPYVQFGSTPNAYLVEAPVEQSYFDDAVFLGDSRTVGLKLYSGWENCDYLADVGMTIYDCLDRDISYNDISHTSAREILSTHRYGKVYIMLGINECGSKLDNYIEKYQEVIEQIHDWQPEATIVVQAIMKVGAQKSASHPSINNSNISKRNERLKEFANDWYIYYLDINEAVCDSEGNLTAGYSFDQVHLYAKYYSLWCDYLLQHGFVLNQ